jgi:hypothetical protein
MVYDRALYWQWVSAVMINAVFGNQGRQTNASEYNAIRFAIEQLLIQKHTMTIVKVLSCTGEDLPDSIGTVDVMPMITQVNGSGQAVPHGELYQLPYVRIQGGTNGIVIDPKKDDIGLAIFAERDITKVVNTKQVSPPDSRRMMSMSDGVYLGGILNGELSQYIRFAAAGLEIATPMLTVLASMTVNGNMQISSGATGSFTTPTGSVVTVVNGIVTNIT